MPEQVRVLRLLEYVGTRAWVEKSLELRTVKGTYRITEGPHKGSFIQEGILGEFAEVLETLTMYSDRATPEPPEQLPERFHTGSKDDEIPF